MELATGDFDALGGAFSKSGSFRSFLLLGELFLRSWRRSFMRDVVPLLETTPQRFLL
jgi:hypothetical protein